METLDTIFAWQAEPGDLVQFEAYEDDEPYIELIKIDSLDVDETSLVVNISGESMSGRGIGKHSLDYYLELEIIGA